MAVISDMNQPLGNKIGNALEIEESIDVLKGKGPADLTELVLTLGSYMVVMGGKAKTPEAARQLLEQTIADGTAYDRFKAMVVAQGGDPRVMDDYQVMPQAKYQIPYPAKRDGVVTKLAADEIGTASMLLGGGRQKADDELDYSVGIELHHKLGDTVKAGEPLLTIYSNRQGIEDVEQLLDESIEVSDHGEQPTLIHEIIE